MGYTRNIIEIKRGIIKTCCEFITEVIATHPKCEDLYQDIFTLYGLHYDTETIKQKRVFVAAATEYFIVKRCGFKRIGKDNKYNCSKRAKNKKAIIKTIDTYFEIRQECSDSYSFRERFAEFYKDEVKDFSEEISINRDDTLSDFAKAVEKLYYFKDED